MNRDDFPAPEEGFVITHFLVVADQDRSREFYRSLLGGQVLLERDPATAGELGTLVTEAGVKPPLTIWAATSSAGWLSAKARARIMSSAAGMSTPDPPATMPAA